MRIGVVGASGYTGSELVRLLAHHPGGLEVAMVTSRSQAGTPLADLWPNLRGYTDLVLEPYEVAVLRERVETVVLAVPHKVAQEYVPELLEAGLRVVDFSADYRLHNAQTYEQWYHTPHTSPHLLQEAVYGLPERYRERIRTARLVANPGCNATSAILGALPLVENRIVDPTSLIADTKTGISGAGPRAEVRYLYATREANVVAYNIAVHRHTPEIEQELQAVTDEPVRVSFTPHLVPMSRGILTTIYADLKSPWRTEEVLELYRLRYKDEPFVHVLGAGQYAETKAVLGSNNVHISLAVDERVQRVIVTCVLDNLVKGAAGAVVQNLNLMAGLDETAGLRFPGLMP
ncbi:MAG: N-acetyl-gamma-glutamyl-phosphate reductase [Candidatus Poribacteria bacterium]|nr:MAG: N-acetyl-gamma-glutamyl-phosphate reductase [Candidatus Poribacteria bacterium]